MNLVKNHQVIANLQREVDLLRSFVIGFVSRDREGKYHPGFIARIHDATKQKPVYKFGSPQSFLEELGRIK